MKRIAYISLLSLMVAGCAKSSEDEFSTELSIASLRDVESNYSTILITDHFSVTGSVTANDKYGEFSSCIIIEDQSAALKLMCDVEDNYKLYPVGSKVRINCSGLYLRNLYGAIILGAEPTEDYTVGTISQSKIGQYVEVADESEPIAAQQLSLDALTQLNSYSYIRFSNIKIVSEQGVTTFCTRDSLTGFTQHTSHQIIDANSRSVELFVNRNCTYADMPLPEGEVSLGVIIEYFDGEYSATISDYNVE